MARDGAVRPRAAESEATRRAILDAAAELLASAGEEGLSIRELCARSGVTPPTVYHHFGDKAALVDRVVDECFTAFDVAFDDRTPPSDPVERVRWGFDAYVAYGVAHPVPYRLMFQRSQGRPTPAGLASYDRLRRMVRAVDDAGRLLAPLEDAAAAIWSSVHGVTSLVIAGFWPPDAPAIALVRDAMLAQLASTAPRRRARTTRTVKKKGRKHHGRT
ncbi:TetR/AcrR family transcriptional regulator [Candidatus Binatia bacterium]|jgi:AcrR family transcriptional regulator|nr:TetR/AcrR family transcriptional regulator [Candidatus Binatia bacterium]